MRIVAISDTHGHHRKVQLPEGDVLVHAGDVTMSGELDVMDDFCGWLHAQPHRHKVLVPGNHDFSVDYQHPRQPKWPGHRRKARDMFDAIGVEYLVGRGVVLDGVKFWGGPWVPNLPLWAFAEGEGKSWNNIPHDVEVLVTHGPLYGLNDLVGPQAELKVGQHVGSFKLGNALLASGAVENLKLHVHGHTHEGYGITHRGGIDFVCACTCTRRYEPTNPPIVVDVPS